MKAIKQLIGLCCRLIFVAIAVLILPQELLPENRHGTSSPGKVYEAPPPDDTTPPVITCPADITIMVSGPQVVNYDLPVVTDDSGETIEPELISGLESGSLFPLGTTINEYQATDEAGNTSTPCSFTVTLIPYMTQVLDYDGTNSKSMAPQGGLFKQRSFYLLQKSELQETDLSAGSINSIGFMYGVAQDIETTGNIQVWLQNTEDVVSRIDTDYEYETVTDNSLTLTDLDPGDYEWQVKSVCGSSENWSDVKSFSTPDITKCNKPFNLKAINVTSESATLQWETPASAGSDEYIVNYRMFNSTTWITHNPVANPLNIQDLMPDSTYIWNVKRTCSSDNMSPIASSTFKVPLPESCAVPYNCEAVIIDGSVSFSWDGANTNDLYYVMFRRAGTSDWISVPAFSNSLVLLSGNQIEASLKPGTKYYWKVVASCSGGTGSTADFEFTTNGPDNCYAPVELSESNLEAASVVLNWPETCPAESYVVRYRLKDAISWENAKAGMEQVKNSTVTIPASAGRFDIPLDTEYPYEGNGLYVAIEYSSEVRSNTLNSALSSQQNTSVKGYNGLDSLVFILSFDGITDETGTYLPENLKAARSRPVTFFGSGTLVDNAEIAGLYTLGNIALPYTNQVPVKALIKNLSQNEALYPVSLTVYDAKTNSQKYTDTQEITIPSMSDGFVTFNDYWPGQLSTDSIVVSVPQQAGEIITSNNSMYILQNANMSVVSFDDDTPALTGAGAGAEGGMLLVKHNMKGCGSVEKALVYLYPSATGEHIKTILMDAQYNILDESDDYLVDTTDIFSYHAFTFPQAPMVKNADYYIGISLEAGSSATPLGVQWDGIQPRNGTYYKTDTDGNNMTELSPLAGRFMIRAVIKPSMPVPYISGSVILCTGGSNFLQTASKTNRFASSVISVTTNEKYSSQILGTPDSYPTYSASKAWFNKASYDTAFRDKIILAFQDPLPVNFIDLYETYNPGAVDSVFIKNNSGAWVEVYSANSAELPPVARINHISFPETDYNVTEIKISVHSGKFGKNHALDAVSIGQEYDPATFDSYLWSTGETSQSVTVSTPSQYKLTVTNSEGCSWSDSIVLAIPPPITAPVITWRGPLEFCAGDTSVMLKCDKTGDILWSNGETTDSIKVTNSGTYSVSYNDGCNTAVSESVSVTVNPSPTPTTTGGPVCEGLAATLACQEEYSTYEWSTNPVQYTPSVVVSNPDLYYLTVTDVKGCTGKTSVSVYNAPSPDPEIRGESGFCPGGSVELFADNFNSYLWSNGSVSDKAVIYSPGLVTVTVSNSFGCYATASKSIIQYPNPLPVIGGTTSLCQGNTTTLDAGAGYTSYVWSNGTRSRYISVDTAGYFTVTVIDRNGCTGSSSVQTNLDGALPAVPGPITGPVKGICNMPGINYSITPMDNTTMYVWTVPDGMTITGGQGTNSISVNAGTTNGWISVAASNTCGQSPTWNGRKVFADCIPARPGAITGPSGSVCGLSLVSYYINEVFGATSYSWTAPAGATIASGNGSAWVTVAFSSTFSSGNLCVTAQNSCGTSQTQCLYIMGAPPQPGQISGPVSVCRKDKNVSYSITPLTNVTSYQWTVPQQASVISGQGTPSILVNFGTVSGNVTVKALNSCGTSQVQSKTVSVLSCKNSDPILVNYDPSSYGYPGWNYAWGQQIFNPEIIASAGDYNTGDNSSLSWTIGEPVSNTVANNKNVISQGFQQGSAGFITDLMDVSFIVEVFPVPAKEYVNIRITGLNESTNLMIQLYDVLGNEVFRDFSEFYIYNKQVTVSTFSTGMMLLRVTDLKKQQHKTFRIMKIN